MAALLNISHVLVPVLLCVLVGFALAKLKGPFDEKMVGYLVSNVGYPTLILSHLEGQPVPLNEFLQVMLGALAVFACFAIGGLVFLKILGLSLRAYLSPMMINNAGNIGLPVCVLAFGDQGLAYAMAYVIVAMTGLFTIAMWLPMGKIDVKDILRKPVIYAVLIAIALMATDTRLPPVIDKTMTILGGLAIPLMLLTLGHTLATLQVAGLKRGCALALFHYALAAAATFAVVHLFGFEGSLRGTFILQSMMPSAVATYLWVQIYNPEEAPGVAAFILSSTLLAAVVLPLVLTFWV